MNKATLKWPTGDTETSKEIYCKFKGNLLNCNWWKAEQLAISLERVEELNLGLPNTNLASCREKDLTLGSPDQNSSVLNHQAILHPQILHIILYEYCTHEKLHGPC